MNERIRELRKHLGLTLDKFGERLGVTKTAISRLEKGERNVTDQMVRAICREFGVREKWLRDGVAPMLEEDESLEALLGQSEITDRDRSLVKAFLRLDIRARAEVIRFVEECARELSSTAADQPSAVSDVASRLAELERQNQALMELVAEQREEIDQIKREDAAEALLESQPESARRLV